MKHLCKICGGRIHDHDFFMDCGDGKVCSTCLVGMETPGMGISALFMQDRACDLSKYEPSEQIVEEALLAIS